jgi:membrane fusion protein
VARVSAIVSQSLFRPEVAAARRQRLEGEILLSQPLRAHLLTLALLGIAAVLAAWVALGTYTRSELARGLLVTDRPSIKIVALRPGQVAGLHVVDGQRVRAGQKLATILVEQFVRHRA